jgi:uncharacterized protein
VPHVAPMDQHAFTWLGTPLVACASGALWWPAAALLVVADLHLGRSERLARRGGGLLPPYETAATLDRLASEIARRAPRTIVCLGDSFDDDAAASSLGPGDLGRLLALMAGRDWVWIAGNHDPAPLALDGRHLAALALGPLVLRHEPDPGAGPGEIVGHLHPKLRRVLGGQVISRPCFLRDDRRLVLPAFGAYTGGLDADHAAVAAAVDPAVAVAIVTGRPCVALPLRAPGRAAERRRSGSCPG